MEFRSCFYMPNGFANEGVYIWGRKKEIERFIESTDQEKSRVGLVRRHRCARTAEAVARKSFDRDVRNTPDHEISCISHSYVRDFWEDPDIRVGRPRGINYDRFNITMPKGLHKELCLFCAANKEKKSRLISALVSRYLLNNKRAKQ